MNAPAIQTALAQPVAWKWACPECRDAVTILMTRGGVEAQNPCGHFIVARANGEHLTVQFSREGSG